MNPLIFPITTRMKFRTLRDRLSRGENDDNLLRAVTHMLVSDVVKSVGPMPLLRRMENISFSTATTTAAIDLTTPEIIINPTFVERHCQSVADLAFILLHERGHAVLTYLANTTDCENFAEDTLINGSVHNMCYESTLTSRWYGAAKETQPWLLLLQPDTLLTRENVWCVERFHIGPWQQAQLIYESLYEFRFQQESSTSEKLKTLSEWYRAVVPAEAAYSDLVITSGDVSISDDAAKFKSRNPCLYKVDGTPKGDDYNISFLAFNLPAEIKTVDLKIHKIPELRGGALGAGAPALARVIDANRPTGDSMLAEHMPARPTNRDAMVARTGYISAWEHEASPASVVSDLYVDFSGSMAPSWGLAFEVAKSLRNTVRRTYGFASQLALFRTTDPGISVGHGTRIKLVLDQMASKPAPHAIWVTDLEFMGGWTDQLLNLFTSRKLEFLTILIPREAANSAGREGFTPVERGAFQRKIRVIVHGNDD